MALMWNRTVEWDEGDWRQFAACRSTEPDLFFPIGTTGSRRRPDRVGQAGVPDL